MSDGLEKDLNALGKGNTGYIYSAPEPKLLECFANPFSLKEMNTNGVRGEIHIEIPEFTSLCPKTGQPDFATIIIEYEPAVWCIESKSLKLYLGSFRNHGEFHESCVNRICNDLVNKLHPISIEVQGRFTPRGGIPFWPVATWSAEE